MAIDPRKLAILEALPDRDVASNRHAWTEEEDEILRMYWKLKRKKDIAKVIGLSDDTCRERYKYLMGMTDARGG